MPAQEEVWGNLVAYFRHAAVWYGADIAAEEEEGKHTFLAEGIVMRIPCVAAETGSTVAEPAVAPQWTLPSTPIHPIFVALLLAFDQP